MKKPIVLYPRLKNRNAYFKPMYATKTGLCSGVELPPKGSCESHRCPEWQSGIQVVVVVMWSIANASKSNRQKAKGSGHVFFTECWQRKDGSVSSSSLPLAHVHQGIHRHRCVCRMILVDLAFTARVVCYFFLFLGATNHLCYTLFILIAHPFSAQPVLISQAISA